MAYLNRIMGADIHDTPARHMIAPVEGEGKFNAADEGKVVSNGALVAQTARESEITANGTYDTTGNNEVTVNVAGDTDPIDMTRPADLPSTYQEVQYIHFDGACYIQVPLAKNRLYIIGVDYLKDTNASSSCVVIGYYNSADGWNMVQSGKIYSSNASLAATLKLGTGNNEMNRSFMLKSQYTNTYFNIGSFNAASGTPHIGRMGEIGVWQLPENNSKYPGAYAYYYIPCYRKSDNAVGMYEVVNGTFYTRSGSGTLTAGPIAA